MDCDIPYYEYYDYQISDHVTFISDSGNEHSNSEKLTVSLLIIFTDLIHVVSDDKIYSLFFPYCKAKPNKHHAQYHKHNTNDQGPNKITHG